MTQGLKKMNIYIYKGLTYWFCRRGHLVRLHGMAYPQLVTLSQGWFLSIRPVYTNLLQRNTTLKVKTGFRVRLPCHGCAEKSTSYTTTHLVAILVQKATEFRPQTNSPSCIRGNMSLDTQNLVMNTPSLNSIRSKNYSFVYITCDTRYITWGPQA